MTGVKGRSGGRRYSKPDAEKRCINKHYKMSQDLVTMIQQLAISQYGTDQHTEIKIIEEAVSKMYQDILISKVPEKTTQGTYVEFRREFLNIYRPDINNPDIPRNDCVSDDFIKSLRKFSADKKHQKVIVNRFLKLFEEDLLNIHEYFLERKLYFDLPLIAAYGLKYFAEPADAS